MEQMAVYILGLSLIVLGFIGCVVPILPGPPLAYCALWLPLIFGGGMSSASLWIGGGVAVAATVIDYVLPTFCARKFNCSRSGVVGCVLGTITGLFFMPLGLIFGPFVGTVVGELTAGKNLADATQGGVGAFLGFVGSVFVKLAAVGLMAWMFFKGV